MRVLLDTATFLWAAQAPEKLSRAASAVILREDTVREISAISISEIAIKHGRGKLNFSGDDARQSLEDLRARILPYSSEHGFALFGLPLHHADPFDRQIIAQAMAEEIPVVTSDRVFRLYKNLRVIW
jgi:PIN domain nuclease of toxin-antitoxin system